MKNRILLSVFLFVVGISAAWAQSVTVSGKVIDNEGLEVIGGSVMVKGTNVGTITDMSGLYSLKVDDASKAVLVFSYIGMKTQEVPVKGQKQINVTLQPDNQLLEEVVVVGYATMKRKDLTGSVASVKAEELTKTPVSDVSQAIAGRMAGVQVIQTDGQPGAEASIRVRGGISITQSNEPLYVIDGFPTEDGMSSLDPADIASIDVLKDASATAIYGARGANGVVLITTKSGQDDGGKATVTFDAYVGVRKLANKLELLSTEEFVLADYERTLGRASDPAAQMPAWQNRYGSFLEIGETYGNRGLDWQDLTMGSTTVTQNYRVGVNGGSDRIKYGMAYSYNKDEGAMVYSGSERHNLSLNVDGKVNDKLRVNARFQFDQRNIWGAGVAGNGTTENGSSTDARFNKMAQILQYRPTIGIQGDDAELLAGRDPLLVDEQGNINPFSIDNLYNEERVKSYYVSAQSLSQAYEDTGFFHVTLHEDMECVGEDDLRKLNKTKRDIDKRRILVHLLENLHDDFQKGTISMEEKNGYIRVLREQDSHIIDAYMKIGKAGIEKSEYKKSLIDKVVQQHDKEQAEILRFSFKVLNDIQEEFEMDVYVNKNEIKDRLQAIYGEHGIKYKVTQDTIKDYYDVDNSGSIKGGSYKLTAFKFNLVEK